MQEVTDHVLSTSILNITPLMTEILRYKSTIILPVTGNSMYPFLRHRIDSVQLTCPEQNQPKKGKIVLTFRPDGVYVLHRIIKACSTGYYLLGDAQTKPEGPFLWESVVAVVSYVHRKGDMIDTNCLSWKFLSQAWLLVRPLRHILIRIWKSRCVQRMRVRCQTTKKHPHQ